MPKTFFTNTVSGPEGTGTELWVTDGTAEGTHILQDLSPGMGGSSPKLIGVLGSKMIFAARDGSGTGSFIYATDGETVTKIGIDELTNVGGTLVVGSYIYFFAEDAAHGRELWRSNGTTIQRLTDIAAGSASTSFDPASQLIHANGKIYFMGTTGSAGDELGYYDIGTGASGILKDIQSGGIGSGPTKFALANGKVVFTAYTTTNGFELWTTDGTPSGTKLVKDLKTGDSYAGSNGNVTLGNGKSFFWSPNNPFNTATKFFVSDGTSAGTVDITPHIAPNASPTGLVASGGKAFFDGQSVANGHELWVSDGTAAGTKIVADLNSSFLNGNVADDARGYLKGIDVNGTFFFWGSNGSNGIELYKSNGSSITLVKEFISGALGGYVANAGWAAVGSELYFVANDGTGNAVWRSDGTDEGTVKVSPASSSPLTNVLGGIPDIPLITGTSAGELIDGITSPAGQPKATEGAEIIDGLGGNDTIKALGGNDTVYGGEGNDSLDGGAGADRMEGGTGNDTYIFGTGDTLVELSGGGTDTVKSTSTFTLATNFEYLTLTGTGTANGTGNSAKNKLTGNDGKNVLKGLDADDTILGGKGDDTLYGGKGKDSLDGGAGKDRFVFDTALSATTNVDRIVAFKPVDDTIAFERDIFKFGTVGKTIGTAAFSIGTSGKAQDANDRIIYETDTGKLFFDKNGNASGGSIQIALLDKNLVLTEKDFLIV